MSKISWTLAVMGVAILFARLPAQAASPGNEDLTRYWREQARSKLHSNPLFRTRPPLAVSAEMMEIAEKDPHRLQWIGLSAIASREVARAIDQVERHRHILDRLPGNSKQRPDWGRFVEDMTATNLTLYDEFAWVHLAYVTGGLKELNRIRMEGALDPEVFDAFVAIGSDRAEQGNFAILNLEQLLLARKLERNTLEIFSLLTHWAMAMPALEHLFFPSPLGRGDGFLAFSRRIRESKPDFGSHSQRLRYYFLQVMPQFIESLRSPAPTF